jgi:lantibiotic modifying enzyme
MNSVCGPLGDSHNFNQKVELIEVLGEFKVKKPRTVFWEWFFLDPSSSFRVQTKQITGCNFNNYLGSISYSQFGTSGICDYLLQPSNLTIVENSSLFNNFGRLLAFATTFGIIDLHAENLIIYNEYVQILDIECVLFAAESPADTLLIPNRASNLEKSLFFKLHQLVGGFSSKNMQEIMEGLYQEFKFIIENRLKLTEIIAIEFDQVSIAPIRFLIRPSREYNKDFPQANILLPMISEEREQLGRSDIPYFFGLVGSSDLFYFQSPNQKLKVRLKNQEKTKEKIQRSFNPPQSLLEHKRLLKIFKQSMLMVASRFLENGNSMEIQSENFTIKFDGTILKIDTIEFSIQSNKVKSNEY